MSIVISKYDRLLLLASVLALVSTILNPYHLLPGFDIYHNLIIGFLIALGLTLSFLLYKHKVKIPYSVLTWVLLIVLIAFQPYLNEIYYADYLVIPIGSLFLTILLSIAVSGVRNKEWFLSMYLTSLIALMLISVFFQFIQMFGYHLSFRGFWIIAPSVNRLDANFTQPNQAAFMLVLSGLASLYFYTGTKKFVWMLIYCIFTIGLALTLSRGGLILGLAAVVTFNLFLAKPLVVKLKTMSWQLLVFVSAYVIGSFFYDKVRSVLNPSGYTKDIVERFSDGSYARISLQEQAYLLFMESPITGQGWGNFSRGAIEHATELGWFSFSAHSHFFLSQIASELGLLGLLCLVPLGVYIIRKINFNMTPFNAVCVSAIVVVLIYSLSEFPLWLLRFLIIFAIFITLIDDNFIEVKAKFSKYLALVSLFITAIISVFIYSYLSLYSVIGSLQKEEIDDSRLMSLYNDIPNTFGLTVFKEHILFYFIAIDKKDIDLKLELAERTVVKEVNKNNLYRYAKLLALNGQEEKSLSMFKATCALDWNGNCDEVSDKLEMLVTNEPGVYSAINRDFGHWYKSFNPKDNRFVFQDMKL